MLKGISESTSVVSLKERKRKKERKEKEELKKENSPKHLSNVCEQLCGQSAIFPLWRLSGSALVHSPVSHSRWTGEAITTPCFSSTTGHSTCLSSIYMVITCVTVGAGWLDGRVCVCVCVMEM